MLRMNGGRRKRHASHRGAKPCFASPPLGWSSNNKAGSRSSAAPLRPAQGVAGRDPALLAGGAAIFYDASLADVGPVAVQDQPVLLIGIVIGEPFTGRTDVNILLGHIAEVLFAKASFRLRARSHRLGQRDRDAGLMTRQDLLTVEVTAPARRHRAAVGIGERELLIRRSSHLRLDCFQVLHLTLELRELLLEPRRLEREHLGRLLPVGRVELAERPCHALLKLCPAPLHLGAREVPVTVVHGVQAELGVAKTNLLPSIATLAFARRPISRQSSTKRAQTLRSARPSCQRRASSTVVLAEIGGHLVIWDKAAQQPHDFEIAPSLALQPSTGL